MTKKFFCTLALFATLVLVFASVASAQEGFVYTNNDSFGANTVSGFSVGSTGTLTTVPGSPFPTGGSGFGGGFFGAPRARATTVGNFVFASNALSADVSVFTVDTTTGTLTLVPGSPFPTGAPPSFFGIALAATPDGSFLIAANDVFSVLTVFSIASSGALTNVGTFFTLSTPDGIQTSPDGKFLAVGEVFSNSIEMFSISSSGSLTSIGAFPAGGTGAVAGVDINCSSSLVFGGEANFGSTIVASESISSTGSLTPVAGSPFMLPSGSNSNVVLQAAKPGSKPIERSAFLFVSNQASNTLTALSVAKSGALKLVAGSPFPMNAPAFFPSGMGTSPDGKFLYVANFTNVVSVFSVGKKGALTEVSGSPFPTGVFGLGLLSLTPFPGRACTP